MWIMNKKAYLTYLAFFNLFVIIFSSCNEDNPVKKKEKINAVKISVSFPVLFADGVPHQIEDSFCIIYAKGYTIYKIPNETLYDRIFINSEGETIDYSIVSQKVVEGYFIFKKNEQMGFFFDSISSHTPKQIEVNKFLSEQLKMNNDKIHTKEDSLLGITILDSNRHYEKYVRLKKKDIWDCDTSYLFFEKGFENIDFSFKKDLEIDRREKLTCIRYISNANKESYDSLSRFNREVKMVLEKIILPDQNRILDLLEKIKN